MQKEAGVFPSAWDLRGESLVGKKPPAKERMESSGMAAYALTCTEGCELGCVGGSRAEPSRMALLTFFLPAPAQMGHTRGGRDLPPSAGDTCSFLSNVPISLSSHTLHAGNICAQASHKIPEINRPQLHGILQLSCMSQPGKQLGGWHETKEAAGYEIVHIEIEPRRQCWSGPCNSEPEIGSSPQGIETGALGGLISPSPPPQVSWNLHSGTVGHSLLIRRRRDKGYH